MNMVLMMVMNMIGVVMSSDETNDGDNTIRKTSYNKFKNNSITCNITFNP